MQKPHYLSLVLVFAQLAFISPSMAATIAESLEIARNAVDAGEPEQAEAELQKIFDAGFSAVGVLTGDEVDLTQFPIHLQHGMDGGPYISASLDFSIDQRTGFTNVGMRRLMLRGRRQAGVDMQAPSDFKAIYGVSHGENQTLPVAFVVGFHPADAIAAVSMMPAQDDFGLIGGLRGASGERDVIAQYRPEDVFRVAHEIAIVNGDDGGFRRQIRLDISGAVQDIQFLLNAEHRQA